MIDRRNVDVLSTHWSVFYSLLFKVVDYFLGGSFRAIYASIP